MDEQKFDFDLVQSMIDSPFLICQYSSAYKSDLVVFGKSIGNHYFDFGIKYVESMNLTRTDQREFKRRLFKDPFISSVFIIFMCKFCRYSNLIFNQIKNEDYDKLKFCEPDMPIVSRFGDVGSLADMYVKKCINEELYSMENFNDSMIEEFIFGILSMLLFDLAVVECLEIFHQQKEQFAMYYKYLDDGGFCLNQNSFKQVNVDLDEYYTKLFSGIRDFIIFLNKST